MSDELLQKNLAMTEEVLRVTRSIRRHLIYQMVMSWIKFLIVVVPLGLAVYYAPRIISSYTGQLQSVLSGKANPADLLKNLPLSEAQKQQFLKELQTKAVK
ncbi:MAG: hypothetical protein HW383_556 [Candidatus Magasanikbacteria bacterium]|nr:hypothetical protein [Candidatus Magasanikbacteria bacterium]